MQSRNQISSSHQIPRLRPGSKRNLPTPVTAPRIPGRTPYGAVEPWGPVAA
ncbi:hypothetical protein BRADI_1g06222v3 [Brachypodium distachyon]|uniref:Uncharacterized protein n=1 Tax=Brachypodium distachyon TaxID=15368 RepID=A0A2K2DI97_BRADI|nr:hypothetical protein BRADI_1g06222v3 [Brachypodium distachyon]